MYKCLISYGLQNFLYKLYSLIPWLIIHALLALTIAITTAIPTAIANAPITEMADRNISGASFTETFVREYFKDVPVMGDIAFCESTFRHFDSSGDVLRGKRNQYDVGVMQINEYYHSDKAEELEYDIYTFAGNLAYARYLYDTKGTAPWRSSKACWGKLL